MLNIAGFGEDLAMFQDQGRHLSVIMKGGRFHKNRLN